MINPRPGVACLAALAYRLDLGLGHHGGLHLSALETCHGVDGLHGSPVVAPVDAVFDLAVVPRELVGLADRLGVDADDIAGSADKLDQSHVRDD